MSAPQDHPGSPNLFAGQPSGRFVWVEHDAVLEREAKLADRGVASEVLVGQEQHLGVAPDTTMLVKCPLHRGLRIARRADRAPVAAAIKAFTGRHGGTICTSSNAKTAMQWAFDQHGGVGGNAKVLFLPDQHLGRNTAVRELGLSLQDCVVFDPHKPTGGLTREQVRAARVILWRGHCSVHGRFSLEAVAAARATIPGVRVIVHPECQYEVVEAADVVGSTERIIQAIASAPDGSSWAVGTELNLVRRLATMFPKQNIAFLEKNVCYCSTMNRIDLPHLVWALESLAAGRVINQITVDPDVAKWAKVALDLMLALPGETAKD